MRGDSDTILTFINLLCHANQDGIVDRHWQAICDETGLSEERIKAALEKLESPDPESRSRENEGRRIVRLDDARSWGWHIVNFKKYRELRSAEDRREYLREYMRERRKKEKEDDDDVNNPLTLVNTCKQSVNTCKQCKPIAETETETETETEEDKMSGDLPEASSRLKGGALKKVNENLKNKDNAAISIPLIPSQGEYYVTQEKIDEWQKLFPGVHILGTLREIKAWNTANPARRKTLSGVERHIVSWLIRVQNSG